MPGWLRPRCRLHRGIMLRIEYHGELLMLLDSDVLHTMGSMITPEGWHLLRPGPERDWPEIIIKPVMLATPRSDV